MVFADVYLQPGAPDPVLDEREVVRIARRHAPDAGPLLRVDESGGEARAYLLDGGVVVKAQRPHRLRPRTSLAKEQLVLGELHRLGDFPVPRPLGRGQVGGTEYLCLTQVPGSPLRSASISGDDRRNALNELGRVLRSIHAVEQSALEASDLVPGDRCPADLRTRLSGIFERLAGAFDGRPELAEVADVRRIAAERLASVPPDTQPVTLHSNPGPEHTFVAPGTGALSGLIDFGDAYRSHPAFDLRPWTAGDDADAVLAGYRSSGPLPPGFDEAYRTVAIVALLAAAARGKMSSDELSEALG